MNISLKHKVIFSLISGFTFAILNSLTNYFFLDKGFSWGIFSSNLIFFGLFFGLTFLWFMKRQTNRLMEKIQIQLKDQEEIKHEGPANLFRGIEGVGGKLLLTDQRLIFKSHKMNIQSGETQLLLDEIKQATPRKTAKLFQNGIQILTNAGENFDFVVYERDNWLAKINALLAGSVPKKRK
ncbi:GRAM domain-containing protein [Fulvivirgaceae bacterium BMA12]|uniref:GRAM domain-containing protein n=1 Tax=Agaribacillus aureus TaxID=3051825 RepID=A0ABT8LBH0_9BACT|nr:GRAM domain-containing protein [Fulvivirgaceae bacterium BMA12]